MGNDVPNNTEYRPIPAPAAKPPPAATARVVAPNFISDIIDADLAAGRVNGVITRFPPEPNGYLHIGHAKAICLNFGIAEDYGGITYLRFDDTNPTTENQAFAESIRTDIDWLGFDYVAVRHASDYFPQLYDYAVTLIERGLAYVDSSSEEEIRDLRGTVTEPGRAGPYRGRSVAENLDLFERMKAGEFEQGAHVLRAKIDMASPNMKMRDPLLYRIVNASHYRTGDDWKIYPLYDMAHPLSDAIEGITHSLCTLEFENNREVYDWLLDNLVEPPRPHQYEFARLNLDYTVMSKRKLLLLANDHVSGWDDPRMPTISALRRKGVTPSAIRDFANRLGVAKANSRTDPSLLDHSIRDDLNSVAPRVLAVLDPLTVELSNLEADETTWLDADYWPHDVPKQGSRKLPLTRELVIERADFEAEPPKGFKRLAPGRAVRLRHGPVVRCEGFETDSADRVVKVICTVVDDSVGTTPTDVKVSGTIHWVSREHGLPMTARLYQPLFDVAKPDGAEGEFTELVNPDSLDEVNGLIEPSVADDDPDTRYQFERLGYFWRDPLDGRGDELVFNRIVALKDGFKAGRRAARQAAGSGAGAQAKAKPGDSSGAGAVKPARRPAAERHGAAEVGSRTQAPAQLSAASLALKERYGLNDNDAGVLSGNDDLRALFEDTVEAGAAAPTASQWLVNEVARELRELPEAVELLTPARLAELVMLVDDGVITAQVGKELLSEVARTGAAPRRLVAQRGLDKRLDDDVLRETIARTIADNPDELASYLGGKTALRGFFVGQVMRQAQGKADPKRVQELIGEALNGT